MRKDLNKLKALGNSVKGTGDYDPSLLEAFANKHPERDYWVTFTCPEFTTLCPKTGQPDFATLTIRYIPAKSLVESKSLKLYLFGFRNHGDFHEDVVNVTTAKSPITSHNDSSSVIRFTIDGMTMMMMGDAQELDAMPRIIKNWSAGYLRSDGIQLAHHVLNDLSPLYHIVKAPVLLIPQSLHRIEEHRVCPKPYGAAKTYAREGMIFFENEYTVGLAVVNGEWTKVYTRDVVYEILK